MARIEIIQLIAILGTVIILSVNSYLDIKTRRIPNRLIWLEGTLSVLFVLISGRVVTQPFLHVYSFTFSLAMGYLLFKVGSMGGGDVKTLVVISIASPGVEFVELMSGTLEAIIAVGCILFVTLLFGHLHVILYKERLQETRSRMSPPLIPYLLMGYILIQVLIPII